MAYFQCCDLETMVSRLECIRVHFVQVSVLVSRPKKGLDNNTAYFCGYGVYGIDSLLAYYYYY